MSGRTVLPALAALLMLAAAPATLLAEDTGQTDGGELWPSHAATDDVVAREGRAAMPFTAPQIEALGRLLRETQAAIARAADVPPEGRIRRVRIGSPGDGAIPVIAVRKGYVTAVSFTDATGAPWPIEEVLVDGRFLPEAALAGTEDGGGSGRVASHLLYLAPQVRALHGNAVVKLRGLAEPLALSLRGGGTEADFRVEVRLGLPGPNAAPGVASGAGFSCRGSGAARSVGRRGASGCGAARGGWRRPGRPGLAARQRPAADDPRRSAVARSVGGGARRGRPLGLPAPGYPIRLGDP